MPHAVGGGHERHGRAEPRRREAELRARRRAGHARTGRDAVVRGPARAAADRGRRRVRRVLRGKLILPRGFARSGPGVRLRPRRHADRQGRGASAANARSDRSLAEGRDPRARRHGPDVQVGRAVPRGRGDHRAGGLLPGRSGGRATLGQFSPARAARARSGARGHRSAARELGLSPNVYVDDQLYVAEETEYSRAYSGLPAPAGDRGRRPRSRGSTDRPRSSSRSPTAVLPPSAASSSERLDGRSSSRPPSPSARARQSRR